MKIRFHAGNKVKYGQDMHVFHGAPSDVVFESDGIIINNTLRLVAPRYGLLDQGSVAYGNGAIYLYINFLQDIDKQKICRKLEEEKRES